MESGPIARKGKNVRAVSRKVMTSNMAIKSGPWVLIGSMTSFLSLIVNEPAITSISAIGTYLPISITAANE